MKACNCIMGKDGHCCQDFPHSSIAERYAKITAQESQMSMEERIKRIREAPSIFDFDPKNNKKETP